MSDAIRGFDAVIIGPGSFFTSLVPPLLVRGVREALGDVRGPIILIANLLTEGRGMSDFSAAEAARWVARSIGRPVDVVIANTGRPSDEALQRYAAEHKRPLPLGDLDRRSSWSPPSCGARRSPATTVGAWPNFYVGPLEPALESYYFIIRHGEDEYTVQRGDDLAIEADAPDEEFTGDGFTSGGGGASFALQLPGEVAWATPATGEAFSPADEVDLAWSYDGSGKPPRLFTSGRCGDAQWSPREVAIDGASGAASVPVEELADVDRDPGASCEVELRLARFRDGDVYGGGNDSDATGSRTASVTVSITGD